MPLERSIKTVLLLVHFCNVILVLDVQFCNAEEKSLRFGFISPPDGLYGHRTNAAATTMAIEKAKRDGLWNGVDVEIVWKNGGCNGKQALGVTVTMQIKEEVDAYIGLPCSIAAINAGKIISFWNLPHLSYSSPDPELADKEMYTTLVRMISPFNRLGSAIRDIFHTFSWHQAVMLSWEGDEGPGSFCEYASRAVEEEFRQHDVEISTWLKADFFSSDEDIQRWLKIFRERGRIVLICVEEHLLRKVMLAAREQGMTNGEYVFIYPNLMPSPNWERLWYDNNYTEENNAAAMDAYRPLVQVALGAVNSEIADEFRAELPRRMNEPPWNSTEPYEEGELGSVFSLYLHDAVYMYALATDDLLREDADHKRNGSRIFQISKTKTFEGVSGTVQLDSNGDRIGNYWLWTIPLGKNHFEKWGEVRMTDKEAGRPYLTLPKRYWGRFSGERAPKDTPTCGFFGERCPAESDRSTVWIIVVAFVMLFMSAALGLVFFRRRKFERDLELMLWKVNYSDIVFMKGNRLSEEGDPVARVMSAMTFTSSQILSVAPTRNGSIVPAVDLAPMSENLEIASYKGNMVSVKRLCKIGIILNRPDHMELKIMRELSHENVNGFVGFCADSPNICILTRYCSKGSLRDILENDAIKLDMMFKASLLFDLVSGLEYIHKSKLKSHGRLKSTNCCIDGRWVLKLTDFGLNHLRDVPQEPNEKYSALLWTAPELLREQNIHRNGTQSGDIYSFGIILQEVLFRCGPYEATGGLPMVPKDLIGRVFNGESIPFRPPIPESESTKIDFRLVNLMTDAWQEEPISRPDISAVKAKLSVINQGRRYNIMDNMIKMLEKYANNLEELVAEKTKQLTEEKKKTDLLLYRMLPGTVADALKLGRSVQPEFYPTSTIYFSDVVGFTELSSDSSPIQIVDFLNDLWTVFDDVISRHNVYKVETIGDAYMVVGGVPNICGDHAIQISDMALEILSSVLAFKIRHKPNTSLRVRIGLHSGPVAAGIVGLTMPRYCLFGDAVNTASRMESAGLPMRIHISETTHSELMKAGIYHMIKRGSIVVKGKGNLTTYWLEGRDGYTKSLPTLADFD